MTSDEFLADFETQMTKSVADDSEILVKLQKLSLHAGNSGE